MITQKKKILFVILAVLLIVVSIVGWQVAKLYLQPETTETANVTTPEAKTTRTTTEEPNSDGDEKEIEERVNKALQTQASKNKKEKDRLEKNLEAFSKAYLTYTSLTAESDFEKAAPYMTETARLANQPNSDEQYEGNHDIYKQSVQDTEIFLDVDMEETKGSFITIATCHSEGEGGTSSDFQWMLKGKIEKQTDNSWLVAEVSNGNPSNFPEQFFQ
ncbi:hypothetical protein [Listeria seeligeri]|uniref:hypothetical protein n=1 Tax=Listeria seeligeri TaxID=1640 RepID=UPI0022EAA9B8|nr:hypothetical protein [Listeria seeligeri]